MTLKFYTLMTLFFILVLGNFVYFFISDKAVELSLFDMHFPAYPVAVWITVPFVFYYIINVLTMSVGSIKAYLDKRNYERDFEKLQDAFYHAYLHKDKPIEYKTARYKLLGQLLENSVIVPKAGATLENSAKIDAVFTSYNTLQAGNVADLKRFSLPKDNYLMVQNIKNALKVEPKKAETILSNSTYYSDELLTHAYEVLIGYANMSLISKYSQYLSLHTFEKIVARTQAKEHKLNFEYADFYNLINARPFTEDEYLAMASLLRDVFVPEERIHMFKSISQQNEKAVGALLYTYLDLEMVDTAQEMLTNYTPEEFARFRAYLELKEHNSQYELDEFVGL